MSKKPDPKVLSCWACGTDNVPLEQVRVNSELATLCVDVKSCKKRWEKAL